MIEVLVPYYRNPKMFELQVENWESWPLEVRKDTLFTIVDDGSPEPIQFKDRGLLNLSIYRIQENIPWNIAGAKNLLALVCEAPWFLMHDIDYMIPFESFDKIRQLPKNNSNRYYNFMVENVSGPRRPRASKIAFYMDREMFWIVGGFNENLSGGWGLQAGEFRRRLEKAGVLPKVEEDIFMQLYDLRDVSDACTTDWERDSSENLEKFKRIDLAEAINFEWVFWNGYSIRED